MTKPSDTESTGSRDTGGNVVSFKRLAGPSVDVKESDGKRRSCQHLHVEIWTDEPILGCVDCGAVVDPHEWIRRLTRDWKYFVDRLAYERREAQAEMRDLRKRLRVLRGEYESEREKREAERAICTLPPRRRLSDG